MGIEFPSQTQRSLAELMGALGPSVISYGADPSAADNQAAFQLAVNTVASAGGGIVHVPFGVYVFLSPFTVPSNVELRGQGGKSILLRGATLPDDQGLVILNGSNITLSQITIDGAVTTPVPIEYGTGSGQLSEAAGINGNPAHATLTKNTSIWIASGSSRIRINGCRIFHTGGYAIFIDAQSDDVADVGISACRFENNRAHFFGPGGDVTHSSWTGGILAKGDGAANHVRGLRVENCHFARGVGNQIWSHSDAFGDLHQNFVIKGNTFKDIARDCIQMGNVDGFSVTGNNGHRIGYMTDDDVSTSTPDWYTNQAPCFLDCAGWCRGTFSGNTVRSINGTGIDTDGLMEGSIVGNTFAIPDSSGDVFYTADQVAGYGVAGAGNTTRGINTGRTFYANSGRRLTITGNTFINCMGGNALNSCRDSLFAENTIIQPTAAAAEFCPVSITNQSGTAGVHSSGLTVKRNRINFGSSFACIVELDTVFGNTNAFSSADINWVFDNQVTGANLGEFKRSANSGSLTGFSIHTNDSSATSNSESYVLRQGFGSTAVLTFEKKIGSTQTRLAQLSDDAFFNVALGGGAATGVITTGNRNSIGWGDAMWTGKLLSDGFFGLYKHSGGSTTYLDVQANDLIDDWALIRFNKASARFEQSVTTSVGARVWTALGGGSPGGSDTHVQYNNGGSFGGESNLVYNNSLKRVTITGLTGTRGLTVNSSFVDSAEGFVTSVAAGNAYQALNGGFTGLTGTFNSTAGNAVQTSGGVTGQTGTFNSTAVNAIQAPNGGINAAKFVTTASKSFPGGWTADAMGTGKMAVDGFYALYKHSGGTTTYSDARANELDNNWALLRFNQASTRFEQSVTTSAGSRVWAAFAGVAGSNTHVQFNDGGVLAGDANFVWNKTTRRLTITGLTGTQSIEALNSYIESAQGFYTPVNNVSAFNAPNGGLTCETVNCSSTAGNAIQAPSGGMTASTATFTSTANNAIQTSGGVDAAGRIDFGTSLYRNGVLMIDGTLGGAFVGQGVACGSFGIGGAGFNFYNGSSYESGLTRTLNAFPTQLVFKGGVLVGHTP